MRLVKALLDGNASQIARIHALWGGGQLERRKEERNIESILALAEDIDAEIRAQFARTIGDIGTLSGNAGVDCLITMLADENPRVRMLSAISLGNLGAQSAVPALIEFAGTIKPSEPYLRHGAIVGLAGSASAGKLVALEKSENASIRRAAVIALRILGNEGVAAFLDDPDPFIASDAARAIHDEDTAHDDKATIPNALFFVGTN